MRWRAQYWNVSKVRYSAFMYTAGCMPLAEYSVCWRPHFADQTMTPVAASSATVFIIKFKQLVAGGSLHQ